MANMSPISPSTSSVTTLQRTATDAHPVVVHTAPASNENPFAVALNVLNAVQLITDAQRDHELAQTMVCFRNALQKAQESLQPLVETNNALRSQLIQSESLQSRVTTVLQAEVEALKEQNALQRQQLEATQQQLIEARRQSEERAAAAARVQLEAEERAAVAAREHAAQIKALIEANQAQMKALADVQTTALSHLQAQVNQGQASQAELNTRFDSHASIICVEMSKVHATQGNLQIQLNQATSNTQAAISQKDREIQNLTASLQQTQQGLQYLQRMSCQGGSDRG